MSNTSVDTNKYEILYYWDFQQLAFFIKKERNAKRWESNGSANQRSGAQIGSTAQQHYRSVWYAIAKMMLTAMSFGNQDGYTTRTSCGVGRRGTTMSALRYVTQWNSGWTSVALVWALARFYSPSCYTVTTWSNCFWTSTTSSRSLEPKWQCTMVSWCCQRKCVLGGSASKRTHDTETWKDRTHSKATLANVSSWQRHKCVHTNYTWGNYIYCYGCMVNCNPSNIPVRSSMTEWLPPGDTCLVYDARSKRYSTPKYQIYRRVRPRRPQ